MAKEKKVSSHLLKAFLWSLQGLRAALKNEVAFRQELFCFVVLFPIGLFLGRTATEKVLLTGALFLVLIIELVNSSMETTLDRISREHHPLSGRAKDMGSAAVFIAIINALAVWGIILFDIFVR